MAPSLHPASYAYAYDQCTNRSRCVQHRVHGLPRKKLQSNFDKKTSQNNHGWTHHAAKRSVVPK